MNYMICNVHHSLQNDLIRHLFQVIVNLMANILSTLSKKYLKMNKIGYSQGQNTLRRLFKTSKYPNFQKLFRKILNPHENSVQNRNDDCLFKKKIMVLIHQLVKIYFQTIFYHLQIINNIQNSTKIFGKVAIPHENLLWNTNDVTGHANNVIRMT